jgi:hypothetical protein
VVSLNDDSPCFFPFPIAPKMHRTVGPRPWAARKCWSFGQDVLITPRNNLSSQNVESALGIKPLGQFHTGLHTLDWHLYPPPPYVGRCWTLTFEEQTNEGMAVSPFG